MHDYNIDKLNILEEAITEESGRKLKQYMGHLRLREAIHRQVSDTHGFTLVELIVVLVIIALLAAAAGPAFMGYIDKARMNSTLNDAKKIYLAAQSMVEDAHNDLVDPDSRITMDRMSELTGIEFEAGTPPYQIVYEKAYNSSNPENKMYIISNITYSDGTFTAKYYRNGTGADKEIWTVTEN